MMAARKTKPARVRLARVPASVLQLLAAASAVCLVGTYATAETLRVHGSTTFSRVLMEPYQRAIEAASGHRLEVIPNKSANGVIDLLEGRADLAMISAPLTTEIGQLNKARPDLAYQNLVGHSISETRASLAVHRDNGVRSISAADLARVLTGQVKTWDQIGGDALPLKTVYVREAGGVTQVVSDAVISGKVLAPAFPIPVSSPVQVVKIVMQEPGALGLAQLKLVKEYKLGELSTGLSISQTLVLVTNGRPSAAMASVIKAAIEIAEKQLTQTN